MVTIKINGSDYEAQEGERLLTVLEQNKIRVPHLCYHHALTPAAACKLCVVEVVGKGKNPSAPGWPVP
jgi:NADH dehydrogenase/NADH:ubiquinone oxidoreductase subunit G